ncbi:MAG TPA: hypothetical protein VLB82_13425, partial [Thermodesulfobacteriota bacterium]|nr:hypothetical protein [Thermodesulfobacteriota bacterium]
MKIAVERPNISPNVYTIALDNFICLQDYGHEVTFLPLEQLTDEYDGYVFLSDYFNHSVKINTILNNKPFMIVSGELFNRDIFGHNYVRVLVNGTTPNFGTWNTEGGAKRFASVFYPRVEHLKRTDFPDTALLATNNLWTDMSFGLPFVTWIEETLEKYNIPNDYKTVLIKVHPKIKPEYKYRYMKAIYDIDKAIEMKKYTNVFLLIGWGSEYKTLSIYEFKTCYTHTSTASVEAAILGANNVATSEGNFITTTLEDLSMCVWRTDEIEAMWKLNQSLFENNETRQRGEFFDK